MMHYSLRTTCGARFPEITQGAALLCRDSIVRQRFRRTAFLFPQLYPRHTGTFAGLCGYSISDWSRRYWVDSLVDLLVGIRAALGICTLELLVSCLSIRPAG